MTLAIILKDLAIWFILKVDWMRYEIYEPFYKTQEKVLELAQNSQPITSIC